MEKFLRFLSDIRVIIAIAVLILILVIWLIVQKVTAGRYRKELEALYVRYNALKSEPLSLKLTRADAISRVDAEAREKITHSKDDFEKAQANLKQIGQSLADTEDEIAVGKLKQAKSDLADLQASVSLGESQVTALNRFLDGILEKETEQRQRVNEQKARFRDLRGEAQAAGAQLSYIWSNVEQNIFEIEKMFSAYEEWSYANDFEKASNELDHIETGLDQLDRLIHTFPSILSDARGVVPNMIETLRKESNRNKNRGVYLDHLQIDKNLNVITGSLKEDLAGFKNGEVDDIASHIEDYKLRIQQLSEEVKKESDSFDELAAIRTDMDRYIKENTNMIEYIQDQYKKVSARFGLGNLNEQITEIAAGFGKLTENMDAIMTKTQHTDTPVSGITANARQMNQQLMEYNASIREIKDQIDNASGDEDRANKQLIKLQVIMNQMQVKLRKYKLPLISDQYQEDMRKANTYIHSLSALLKEDTLNVQLLNSTLKEAIDFIFKLYNDVNNMIAMVIMIENTIVFGNRYRSTYADIDSELTRSELCFRNGEYTQALTIAIATMEKIHPGNYEKMIKENAKSAA